MSMNISMTNGIEIDKLKLGWLQLLIAAFVLGGTATTITVTVSTQQEIVKGLERVNLNLVAIGKDSSANSTGVKENSESIEKLSEKSVNHDARIDNLERVVLK